MFSIYTKCYIVSFALAKKNKEKKVKYNIIRLLYCFLTNRRAADQLSFIIA